MTIQIIGSGCATCKNLYEQTKKAIQELSIEATVDYIPDITKVIELGVMESPVMTIDGKIAMLGAHSIDRIKEILTSVPTKKVCDCGGKC